MNYSVKFSLLLFLRQHFLVVSAFVFHCTVTHTADVILQETLCQCEQE